ncbi:MAG: Tyrosine recombinase XerD, partial [Alphaproteobacteria bacterium MarineAlpha10_Bin1]
LVISVTGVRVSELCAIAAIDVSTDGSSIQVLGKGSRDRIVYVSDAGLREDFMARRNRRINEEGERAPLLVNGRGARLQPQTLRQRLHKLRVRNGMSRTITPHMLRHTAATLLIESGTDIRFVQRLLGHASIATTEIYTQVNDRSLRRAVFQANTLQQILVDP